MALLTAEQKKVKHEELIKRDGPDCYLKDKVRNKHGELVPCKGEMVIDHWDNNSHNNDDTNLHRACRGHNGIKNSRAGQKYPKFTSHMRLKHSLYKHISKETPVQMVKNLAAEGFVIEFVKKTLREREREKKPTKLREIINAAANAFRKQRGITIGQGAVGDYIEKLCNEIEGECVVYQDGDLQEEYIRTSKSCFKLPVSSSELKDVRDKQ